MGPVICCFCAEPVSGETPVEIIAPVEQAANQALWAHGGCLSARLHPSVPTLLPHEPEGSSVVFLAVTRAGLQQALRLAAGAPVWCGAETISEREFAELKVGTVTRFIYSLKGQAPELLADAIATIQEHHPGKRVWVESADGL